MIFCVHSYGVDVIVDCPKPMIVTELIKDANNGFAFVRFGDKRDRDAAFKDVCQGEIRFRGKIVSSKVIKPGFWPCESTRRYY